MGIAIARTLGREGEEQGGWTSDSLSLVVSFRVEAAMGIGGSLAWPLVGKLWMVERQGRRMVAKAEK